MENKSNLAIKSSLDAWNSHITRTDKLFNELSNEQLQQEVAPGRNTGVYLLGHLAAVHDNLFTLLGIGDKMYPELEEVFLRSPDKSELKKPGVQQLRDFWQQVNEKLSEHFNRFTSEDWFEKHTSVSDGDFKNEPHRNRLNVLVSRTNHLAYHLGQLAFLK